MSLLNRNQAAVAKTGLRLPHLLQLNPLRPKKHLLSCRIFRIFIRIIRDKPEFQFMHRKENRDSFEGFVL